MKTFVIENNLIADASDNAPDNANNDANWYFLADSAICNAGKPFFIPELEDFADARLVIALKVNLLVNPYPRVLQKDITLRRLPQYISGFRLSGRN